MDPKVSVLMITYNQEKFVDQSVRSAVAQQTNFDYEVVIRDDFSADRTPEELKQLQQQHPQKIRLLPSQKNLGFQRNFASVLEACRGEYVAFLEGDDYWTCLEKIQSQADFLDIHPECAVCFHDVQVINDIGDMVEDLLVPNDQKQFSTIEDIIAGNFIPGCSMMFRRGLFGPFPEWLYNLPAVDWPLNILNAQYGTIGYINKKMAAYRLQGNGIWSSLNKKQQTMVGIQIYQTIYPYLKVHYARLIEDQIARRFYKLAGFYSREGNRKQSIKQLVLCLRLSKGRVPLRSYGYWLLLAHELMPGIYNWISDRTRRMRLN